MKEISDSLTPTATDKAVQSFMPRQPTRRQSRETALRAAYAIELREESPEEILQDPLINDGRLPPAFTVRLLSHMFGYRELIDETIRSKVERWEFHRIALVDKIILRIACAELLYFPDVPPKVAINEAIEIAKLFSTDKSGRFVNGILDAIYNDLNHGRKVINEGQQTSS